MAGDRARRTSSGSTLRLVDSGDAAAGPADDAAAPAASAAPERSSGGLVGALASDSIVLPGKRQSVTAGRHWVVRTSASHGVTGMANQVLELLSSELLANAVVHGPADGGIGVQLASSEAAVRVSVSDSAVQSPVVVHSEPAALAGRGMAIVEAMSSRWGVEVHEDGGKTVWFELDLDDF